MCIFHVTSLTSSLKEFVGNTNLPIDQCHEKGEVSRFGVERNFGFSCEVSNRSFKDIEGQFEDIKLFLKTYRVELISLSEEYSISDWKFDLPYQVRDKASFVQTDYISPSLIKLLAEFDIGLQLSLYASAKRKKKQRK
jgi:hypothetical protein